MERIKSLFAPVKASSDEYEPLTDDDSGTLEGSIYEDGAPFSWIEYSIFALIGVAMLWAWNMFLAAAPYFQTRVQSDPFLLANSQSAILAVSTIANLLTMLTLTNMQSSANYPFRIYTGLLVNAATFALLTISTSHFLDISAATYLAFLLLMVGLTAWASGMIQNGALAYAASFGRTEYTQAIMAGQGVAGILPPLTQMVSFLAFSSSSPNGPDQPSEDASATTPTGDEPPTTETSTAAFVYFLTAVLISAITVAGFVPLVRRHNHHRHRLLSSSSSGPGADLSRSVTSLGGDGTERSGRRFVSMPALFRKLRWVSASVFLCFVIAMFFPVFTAKILSVHDERESGRLFAPGAFIPLGFFFWNLGDLAGRVSTMLPFSLRHRPKALFAISVARLLFLPMYLLCNLHGDGAVVPSDVFYLLVVQFPFGLTNGWLGSSAMMAAGEWVADGEREAAGGFMGLCLVAGLAVGSVLSFTAAGI
ncbi:hypothetical protein MFIFM68171_10655 [Madurella fahalii]|uniref:Nucleoside transporter n=1 Tax=Madurella fahalii TaxID=1157608 RepID=A0ABQ0GRS5_9PEZI